ncbi:MAG: nitrous oxide reductase accessory protein NosL [Desulfomonilaceae bacterium]
MQKAHRHFVLAVIFFIVALAGAAYCSYPEHMTVKFPDGSVIELPATCPVCGMRIYSNSELVAAIVLSNGKVLAFDSIAEFFQYLLSPDTFGFKPQDLKNLFVMAEDSKKYINAKDAVYTIGQEQGYIRSLAPEMEAFSNQEAAAKFISGEKEAKIRAFSQVTLQDVVLKKKNLLWLDKD